MHLNDLFEAVRPALLYHCTSPDAAESILDQNTILARTDQQSNGKLGRKRPGFRPSEISSTGFVNGVSLTRDPFFARRWGSGEGVVLVFDGNKVKRDFRLEPYDHFNGLTKGKEAEEFLIGPMTNVSRYLVSIQMSKATNEDLWAYHDQFVEGHQPYHMLLNHPLLRVEGEKWNNMSGKIEKAA